ncbi:class I SAM-dependent methyltransferase [Mycolicibacterium iranicum]|uniref:S-adenosyl-L-methionine-dependent methyltransferase n=1 Tax=Mycolicibacterium iranicum TaxID=912594 RepID=A0ABT4HKL0_MYCIR|nr:class I SAM-dependent methyltransferase [Mycolicibacterium iranicum]MCZ0730726.1 class I SAM-dependent methyltransferase [Mycolicibacterium iranicum]
MTRRRLDNRASWTAQVCAAQRAAETLQPSEIRRLDDPYARHFVVHPVLRAAQFHPLAARAFISMIDRQSPNLHTFIVLRVRYVEDVYRAALDDGIDQIVLLGAGFDTTSLRWAASSVTVFEVDAPSTLSDKRTLLDAHLPSPADNARTVWVPCDFEHDQLQQRLLDCGFDPARPCVVAWIGVTMFLTREAIAATLADLAALCAPHSRLVLDYIDEDVVTEASRWAGARRVARSVARRGEPYRTGFTQEGIVFLLAQHGFACTDHARAPSLAQRYTSTSDNPAKGDDWLTVCAARRN